MVFLCGSIGKGSREKQEKALLDATILFNQSTLESFFAMVKKHIKVIVFTDMVKRNGVVNHIAIIQYQDSVSDNYIYLASMLVQLATMQNNITSADKNKCYDRSKEEQRKLLLNVPGDDIYKWFTEDHAPA